ncbi:MAG: hypothetical protein AAGH57_10420 [Pseudomonadota bacterium]
MNARGNRFALLAAPVGAFALSGCAAELDVRVAVLNPSYIDGVQTELALLDDVNALALGDSARAQKVSDEAYDELRTFREECFANLIGAQEVLSAAADKDVADYLKQPAKKRDAGRLNTLRAIAGTYEANLNTLRPLAKDNSAISGLRDTWFQRLVAADNVAVQTIGTELSTISGLPGLAAYHGDSERFQVKGLSAQAKSALTTRNLAYQAVALDAKASVQRVQTNCLARFSPPPAVSSAGASAKAAGAIEKNKIDASTKVAGAKAKQEIDQAALTTVTGDGRLLNDMSEAYYVVNAPRSAWAEHYNKAYGEGQFGNTSIAIKMNDTADFTVKGFVFDGRSTAKMVSKIATQAVATIAAANGAPIALTRKEQDSPEFLAKFSNSEEIADYETQIAVAEAQEEAYRRSLFRIANTILTNFNSLEKKATSKDATDLIKATVDANGSTWKKPE